MAGLDLPQADQLVNRMARKDLVRTLLTGLALGAAMRGGAGIYGNVRRNMQRKKEREALKAGPEHDIVFQSGPKVASKQAAMWGKERPWWFVPSMALGAPASIAGGWGGLGMLMKRYRKSRDKEELNDAKQEFEEALASENQTKFSADLDTLAQRYASGELDEELEKSAGGYLSDLYGGVTAFSKGIPPMMYTLMALAGVAGTGAGWKLTGQSDDQKALRAHREASRRRRVSKPVSLVARRIHSPATDELTTKKEPEDDYEPEESRKAAMDKRAGGLGSMALGLGKRVLQGAPAALATAAITAPATAYAMTNTRRGKDFLANRMSDLMQDPKYMNQAVDSITSAARKNPAMMAQVYERAAPMIKWEMLRRHPWIGRLMQHYVP